MKQASVLTIMPSALVVLAVVLGPFLVLAWQSTRDLNYFEQRNSFVGTDNYVRLAQDEAFLSSVAVTVKYAVAASIIPVIVGLSASVALYSAPWGGRIAPLLLAPFLVAPIVVAMVFALLLDGQLGLAPRFLAALGVSDPENIVGHGRRVFWSLVAIDTWQWYGVFAYVFYARMKRVPLLFQEMVVVSGGGALRKLRDVWIPAMLPVVAAVTVFKVIWSLGDAERIDALTAGGGPHGAMRVFSIWMERQYFRYADFGYGAAAGILFYFIALVGIGVFILLLRTRRELS